jgi:Domain of unknown function (DUF4288)
MKRYLVKLMFNINIDNGSHASQFDEQIRIVEAYSMESAFQKARTIGKKEEEIFINNESKMVNWQFIDVVDVYELESIKDGEQVYSTTHENTERHSFINYIRQKAMVIQAKSLTFA